MDWVLFGLLRGAGYLLVAMGLFWVLGLGRILNLCHGVFFLVAAYVAAGLGSLLRGPGSAVLACASAVAVTALSGYLLYRFVLRAAARSPKRAMVLGLAVNSVVSEAARATFGTRAILAPRLFDGSVSVAGSVVATQSLLVLPAALAILGLAGFTLHRTRPGLMLRAAAQDPEGAEILGISVDQTLGWTFAAAAGVTALGACLLAPMITIGPTSWIAPLVKSFAVVVLGGTRSLLATAAAAFGLAFAEVLTSAYVSESAAEYVGLLVIAVALAVRPAGLVPDVA